MNEDDEVMDFFKQVDAAMQDANNIKKLNSMCGELFAAILCYDVRRMEKQILNAMNNSRVVNMLSENDKLAIGDKVALLGCLDRFMNDLLENTTVAKICKKKYDAMVEATGKPLS